MIKVIQLDANMLINHQDPTQAFQKQLGVPHPYKDLEPLRKKLLEYSHEPFTIEILNWNIDDPWWEKCKNMLEEIQQKNDSIYLIYM